MALTLQHTVEHYGNPKNLKQGHHDVFSLCQARAFLVKLVEIQTTEQQSNTKVNQLWSMVEGFCKQSPECAVRIDSSSFFLFLFPIISLLAQNVKISSLRVEQKKNHSEILNSICGLGFLFAESTVSPLLFHLKEMLLVATLQDDWVETQIVKGSPTTCKSTSITILERILIMSDEAVKVVMSSSYTLVQQACLMHLPFAVRYLDGLFGDVQKICAQNLDITEATTKVEKIVRSISLLQNSHPRLQMLVQSYTKAVYHALPQPFRGCLSPLLSSQSAAK
eukprot:TRINITY_DN4383_c0_g1_i16.p1 TRINITY_DN4383_c0_g1~~TRINITY_DN4383_c0_g1_i16.p1  ORF type:complete len:279 (+),score=47.76 TRINITY_DN4383_c0_g1_i16:532-1368(+)